MARPLRIEYEGAFYHITARGNERKKIFFNKSDYKVYKHRLQAIKRFFWRTELFSGVKGESEIR